jgi:MinD superfamily P-loop ATPase
MSYKIAIASGKGGTGKTTVSVSLFQHLNKNGLNAQLVDCDVEEPNDLIFFNNASKTNEKKKKYRN